jgi:hypothetical protein
VGDSADDTIRWLARKNEEWLLVFDGADDTSVNLRKYFPPSTNGNIIITSRNSQTRIHAPNPLAHSKVPSLIPKDAKELLLEISGMKEIDEVGKLATKIVEVRFCCLSKTIGS